MEFDWFDNVDTVENMLPDVADNDGAMFEGERCGICMDIIIDRGVLDCCQHWFCFACIDNWSTITNLCPLCQNEFQLITCVPVYDTIGGNNTDEDSIPRDDDWSVEGKNNTLSFPSYYIDENSVTCLDGDGCKLRSGSVNLEENLTFDTSIACDSCDTWYHSFCVGFDTESTEVESWLCPRCLVEETHKLDASATELWQNHYHSGSGENECSADIFSGKVSISVADDGETAVVVSMVDQKTLVEEPTEKLLATQCLGFVKEELTPEISSDHLPALSSQNISNDMPSSEARDIGLPISTDEGQHCTLPRDTCHPSADESNAQSDILSVGEKRRRKSQSAHASERKKARLTSEGLSRGTKAKKTARRTSVVELPDTEAHNTSQDVGHDRIRSRDERVKIESAEEVSAVDIVSIVQGIETKILRRNPADKFTEGRRDAVGPRVKKIVRRPVEDKESSDLVQNLRKEIREAIRDKSCEDLGKSILDQKLLAAFRAAVAVPGKEPVKKVSASAVKAKRLMLQKGKTREKLTKKIYATTSGRRRHDWYRDCEVEFWKHRCPKTTKFEKIETLKSVLNLLKFDPNAAKAEKNSTGEGSNSILSRLYLADATVFPRKDDIKPLSALDSSTHVSTSTEDTKADKTGKTPSLNSSPSIRSIPCLDNKQSKSTSSSMKTGAVSGKRDQTGTTDKTDKRKWALQVLARKTTDSTNLGHQKQEDAGLKGNYPLLVQLPIDMRPKLESCLHNKIPNSVRQTQLYRLAENLLKLTNISPVRKTAATELAIADAINIEMEIANRSKSKVVYLNLCSQELKRHKSTESQSAVEESNPSSELKVSNEVVLSNSSASLDPDVEKALRDAGLLADDSSDDDDDDEVKDRDPDNVLEMDSHPELDIYGEFEYDIEDEDYIGASAIKDVNLQTEEGESKLKVVFSTLSTDKQETVVHNSDTPERSTEKVAASDGSLMKVDNETSLSLPPVSTSEVVEEPNTTDYEELYGPDKEPLFPSFQFDNQALAPSVESSLVESGVHPSNSGQPNKNETNPGISVDKQQQREIDEKVTKKVEAYIKEHIRPLCKSGVITAEQYRWAVGKTTDKVMKFHLKAKNANFLIKEGEKVKKLAEQYVEAANLKDKDK